MAVKLKPDQKVQVLDKKTNKIIKVSNVAEITKELNKHLSELSTWAHLMQLQADGVIDTRWGIRYELEENKIIKEAYSIHLIPKGEEYRYSGGQTNRDFAGNFAQVMSNHDHDIYSLDSYDMNWVKDVKLKPGERIYRYETHATRIGKMSPLVKINAQKGLVYYLTDKAHEEDIPEFENKGIRMRYLNLVQK